MSGGSVVLTITWVAVLLAISCHSAAAEDLRMMEGPGGITGMVGSSAEVQYPDRPDMFKSPQDLRRYLEALNAYYAIAGRPRLV